MASYRLYLTNMSDGRQVQVFDILGVFCVSFDIISNKINALKGGQELYSF